MAKLESLIVDLQVNSAELRKGLDEANEKLRDFGSKMDAAVGTIKLAAVGATALKVGKALGEMVLHGAETADAMGKMAQSAGVGVESFSALNYAASLSDVSTEELGKAMATLNKNIVEAATGTGNAGEMFSNLGISVSDASGNLRGADAVMADVATKFASMANGAEKSQLAVDLLGKSGRTLIPMLNGGAKGLAEMATEARGLGAVITDQAAKSAEEFNDNLTRMQAHITSIGQSLANELTPALAQLSKELITSKDNTSALQAAGTALVVGLKAIGSVVIYIGAMLELTGESMAKYASAGADLIKGVFSGRSADWKGALDIAGLDLSTSVTERARARLEALWSSGTEAAKEGAAAQQEAVGDLVITVGELEHVHKKASKAVASLGGEGRQALHSLVGSLSGLREEIDKLGDGDGLGPLAEMERRLKSGDLSKELEKMGSQASVMAEEFRKAAEELQRLTEISINKETERAVASGGAAMEASNRDRTTAFHSVGLTETQRVTISTEGFKDFDAALSTLASQTEKQTRALGEAAVLRSRGDRDGAAAMTLVADEAGRAAEKAGGAADAFQALAERAVQMSQAIIEKGLQVLASTSRGGAEIAGLIKTGMEGFKAGGIIGAVIAVIADLLARLESVGKFFDNVFDDFMQAFGKLDGAFSVLFESLTESLAPVMRSLEMTFGAISKILKPIFEAMQTIMQPFEALADGLMDLLDSTGILNFVIGIVSGVFKVIAIVVSAVMLALYSAWGAILKGVRGVMAFFGANTTEIDATISKHDAATKRLSDNIDRLAKSIGPETDTGPAAATGAPADSTTVGPGWLDVPGSIGYLSDADRAQLDAEFNGPKALDASATDAAAALDKFSSSLTNIPQGFKYALNAFNSMRAEGAGEMALGNRAPQVTNLSVTVQGSVLSESDLADIVAGALARNAFRKHGISSTANYR